jgi:DsbC/DsbD-like thiol-disulfide interchange protein
MTTGLDRLRPHAAPRVWRMRAQSSARMSCAIWSWFLRQGLARGLAAIALLTGVAAATAGEDASSWDGDAISAVRLIAGSMPASRIAPLRAGLEIRIKAGWHTYWRYPGDAGVPPRIDFGASRNVKAVDVRFPAPQPIAEQGLTTIGYTSDVVLPLAVVPLDRSKPVTLSAKLGYAVCERLCVPAEGQVELLLTEGPSSQESVLAMAEARVPRKVELGADGALAIRSVRREDGSARPRIIVDVVAPAGVPVVLFAEGPGEDWALPVPTLIDGAPAPLRRFAFDLDGAPPGASYEKALITLTAVAGEEAIEVATRLD